MEEMFDLEYNFGNKISILKISETEGILFIKDRKESVGYFVVQGQKRMPVVSFEMPPETCGVKEKEELNFYTSRFIFSLNQSIERSNIKKLFVNWRGKLPERYLDRINASFESINNDYFIKYLNVAETN